jgi:pimeloyl-ACP methyl ester carboxylesterase
METLYADAHVGKIQYRHGGSGRALVYLHSANGEGEGLLLLDLLAERYDVVAPMFPGFGDSEGLDQIDDMEDATFHLLDLFERLGVERPVLVGSSLGGWMAAELATRYPDRVERLVLVNPAGLYLEGAEIKDIFGRKVEEMVPDLYYDQQHPMAQLMLQFAALAADRDAELPFEMVKPVFQTMAATAKLGWDPYLHNPKLRKRLWRISAPTLVVRGADDTLIPEAHARTYAAEIPGARYQEIGQAAHMVTIERPDALASAIAEFASAP